jgi:hypothetical protein
MSPVSMPECIVVSKNSFLELAEADEPPCRLRSQSEILIRHCDFGDATAAIEEHSTGAVDEQDCKGISSNPKLLWSMCDADEDTASTCSTCDTSISSAISTASITTLSQSGGSVDISEVTMDEADGIRMRAAKGASCSSLILRNLPTTLSRDDLLAVLAEHGYLAAARFLYLPIDAASGSSLGYAFLSFESAAAAEAFCISMHGEKLWADRALQVSRNATCGTVDEQVRRFRDSALMHGSVSDELRPILLQDGVRVEFPAPTKKLRAPRQRDQQRLVAKNRKGQQVANSSCPSVCRAC